MRQTKSEIYMHFVWSTLNRQPTIVPEARREVYRCIEAEARALGCDVLALGGTEDHIHLVVKMPTILPVAALAKQVKGLSSHFARDHITRGDRIRWQNGYGVFSVGRSQLRAIVSYVRAQREHHARGGTREEWEETSVEACPAAGH